MAVSLSVTVEGLDRLARGLTAAPRALGDATRRQLTAASLLIEGTARQKAPRDTGRLSGSITYRISGTGGDLTSRIGPSVNYGLEVEVGRKPGTMPPVAALAGWARRHGGRNPYLVARGIKLHGTKAQPYMQPAYAQHRGDIETLMARVGVRVVTTIAGL